MEIEIEMGMETTMKKVMEIRLTMTTRSPSHISRASYKYTSQMFSYSPSPSTRTVSTSITGDISTIMSLRSGK
jgi:hypothetical protein